MRAEDDTYTMLCCASWGIAGGDDIKLKKCTACHLVRYCSVKCQEDHRPQHKRECKKRAAELHDDIFFKQPESSHMEADLSKRVCQGCDYANQKRELEGKLHNENVHSAEKLRPKHRNCRIGRCGGHYQLSISYHVGQSVEKDEKKQLHHAEKAAIGGHPDARYNLAIAEEKRGRMSRAVKHFIIAAKLGDDGSLEAVKDRYKAGF
eukprot:scaffold1875_cov124-Skeletonema_menzelii.AAC.3